MNKKTLIILAVVVLVAVTLIGISTLFLTQNQDNRSGATAPTPPIIPPTAVPLSQNSAQTSSATSVSPTETPSPSPSPTTAQLAQNTCSQPTPVTNVKVSYPYINSSGQTSFVQAGCTWDAQAGAASYALTVTEVETTTIVMQQNVPAGTTAVSFNINQGKTYKCDVSAVNSCGAVSVASSDQLLCSANGLVESPTPSSPPPPTISPTAAPTLPAASPSATTAPRPTLAPTGSADSLFIGIAIAAGIILFGGFLFVL